MTINRQADSEFYPLSKLKTLAALNDHPNVSSLRHGAGLAELDPHPWRVKACQKQRCHFFRHPLNQRKILRGDVLNEASLTSA